MTVGDVELSEGEHLMDNVDELAYRQITPKMYTDEGRIASIAFGPNSADKGKPSYSRSSIVTAQEARDWHTQYAKTPSDGVWAVSVGEVISARRYVVDDSQVPLPADSGPRAPGHCFVDFRGLTKPERSTLRAELLMLALERGEIPTTSSIEGKTVLYAEEPTKAGEQPGGEPELPGQELLF